jgi:protein O-mannosyl-transferase
LDRAAEKHDVNVIFLLSILWYLKAEMPIVCVGLAPAHAHKGPLGLEVIHPPLATFHFLLYYWLSLAAFMLAMLSKGSTVVQPVLMLGIIWWLRPLTRQDFRRITPFFLLALVLTGVNIWFQTHGKGIEIRNAGFAERLLGAGCVPWFYLYKTLLPFSLVFIYPLWNVEVGDLLWWLPLLAGLIVTTVLWVFRKGWSRPLLFAWGFFCVSLLPVMGFTDVGFMKYSLVADHYQHIAIIGLIALGTAGWSIWRERERKRSKWVTTGAAVVVMLVLAMLTWRQNALYHDAIGLYQATLQKNPGCLIAHSNLGNALTDAGQLPEAIEQYDLALRMKPDYIDAHNNLGIALAKAGRLQEAISHYQKALRLKPDNPETLNNLGNALSKAGQLHEAIENYQHALRLEPDYVDAHHNLGLALYNAGRLQEAIKHYQQALQLDPDYVEAHNDMGIALADAGRLQEAIKHYQQALQLNPDYVEAHNNMGVALANLDRLHEAIEHYQYALRLKPDFTNVYFNLALSYANLKQSSEAIAAAQKGLELARSTGQANLAKQIEDWLNAYRLNLSNFPNASPSSETKLPPH